MRTQEDELSEDARPGKLRDLNGRTKAALAGAVILLLVATAGAVSWATNTNEQAVGTTGLTSTTQAPPRTTSTTTPATTTTSTTQAPTTTAAPPVTTTLFGPGNEGAAPDISEIPEPPPPDPTPTVPEPEEPCPTGTVDASYRYTVVPEANTYDDGATYFTTYTENVRFKIVNRTNVTIDLSSFSIETTTRGFFSAGAYKRLKPGESHQETSNSGNVFDTRPTGSLDLRTADVLAQWLDYPPQRCGWNPKVTHSLEQE